MIEDKNNFEVEERVVLEKFDGDAHPDNLVERIHVVDGAVVQHDFIENGEVVATYDSLQDSESQIEE